MNHPKSFINSIASIATLVAIFCHTHVWANNGEIDARRDIITLEFPTKTFYIHAPEYNLSHTQIERELKLRNGHGLKLFKLFDFNKSVFKKEIGQNYWTPSYLKHASGEVRINPSLKMVGACTISALGKDSDTEKLRFNRIGCSYKGLGGHFEYEGLIFSAAYELPEDIKYKPGVEYCEDDADGNSRGPFPTIYIKDYLTTGQIWIEKPHVTKNGQQVPAGEHLQCLPDRLNPDGIVRCTNENVIADKPSCNPKPYFMPD